MNDEHDVHLEVLCPPLDLSDRCLDHLALIAVRAIEEEVEMIDDDEAHALHSEIVVALIHAQEHWHGVLVVVGD